MVTFVTGLVSFNGGIFDTGDIRFIKFCACIKQFLRVFGKKSRTVELEVWVDQTVLASLKESYLCREFFNNPQIVFRDVEKFFKESCLKYEDYWYDSLRFILLGFLYDNKYRVWIDSDTLLLGNFDAFKILGKPVGIILPKPYNHVYNFSSQRELKNLQQYLKRENIFDLELKDNHVNTGDILGGEPVLCRILCRKILQLIKYIKDGKQSSTDPECWDTLEYVSCHYINCLCKEMSIPVVYVKATHHWTANQMPPCLWSQDQSLMCLDREELIKVLCMNILSKNLDIENCMDVLDVVNYIKKSKKLV